jgi:hypothetical protein
MIAAVEHVDKSDEIPHLSLYLLNGEFWDNGWNMHGNRAVLREDSLGQGWRQMFKS